MYQLLNKIKLYLSASSSFPASRYKSTAISGFSARSKKASAFWYSLLIKACDAWPIRMSWSEFWSSEAAATRSAADQSFFLVLLYLKNYTSDKRCIKFW